MMKISADSNKKGRYFKVKNYYLEETIGNLDEKQDPLEDTFRTRDEKIQYIEDQFKENFTREEILELLIRGQVHAMEDDRTENYYNMMF